MTLQAALATLQLPLTTVITEEDVRKQYHILAKKYHPDRGGDAQEFIQLREAYVYLKKRILQHGGVLKPEDIKSENTHSNVYEDTFNSSNTESTYTPDPQAAQIINNLKHTIEQMQIQYTQAFGVIEHYEHTINTQIHIINSTSNFINQLSSTYHQHQNSLKRILDTELQQLEEQYRTKWWQYIVPTQKMSYETYVTQHNSIIEEYNQQVKHNSDTYLEDLISSYRKGFEEIIETIKNT